MSQTVVQVNDRTFPVGAVHPVRTAGPLAWPVWFFAAATLALHLAVIDRYGYFRDELYVLACSQRLDWCYVDHPPLVVWLTWLATNTLGDSLFALRLVPALSIAAVVVLCGWLARAFGGGRFAQVLAALVACTSPAFLAMGSILTVNALDILWWTLAVVLLVRQIEDERAGRWLLLGVIFGLGGLSKLNIAFFAAALFCGVLLSGQRRWIVQLWPWVAVAVALVIASPVVLWQYANGWPTLEFLRNARAEKNYPVSPFEFAAMQFAVVHPMIFPIWVAGVAWLLRAGAARPFRLFGWAYLAAFVLYCALQGKFYYLFPIYPVLFAAGSVAIERVTAPAVRRRWRVVTICVLHVTTALTAPLAVPLLHFDAFVRYNELLDIQRHLRFERGRDRQLPIVYSDMLGWPELARAVAEVRDTLPADEREHAVIFTFNYGQAAAIDYFGRAYGLPPARSAHNAYHTWGPGNAPWTTVIAVGYSQSELGELFAEVTIVRSARYPRAREDTIPIAICRRPYAEIQKTWHSLKRYR
jgi:hypothetical protein